MTALLSFLCSEPLVSACARRSSSSDENYLLDSDSWDLCTESTSKDYVEQKTLARSPTVWSDDSGKGEGGQKRSHRLRRIMNIFGSALNPLKWSREWSTDSVDSGYHGAYHPHRPGQVGPSRTVSFADRASARYRILSETENSSDEDSEVQHFAIVDIVPGKKPRWISDANRLEERSRWTKEKKPHSFDSTIQRRRSISAQRTCRLNRRAYSLNRVIELDAAVRRNEYASKMAKRPESSYIENSTHLFRDFGDYKDYKEPIFYSNDDDDVYGEVEMHELDALPWNHPSRLYNRNENNAPPRPPKPRALNPEPASHYTNEILAPPRPPKRISTTIVMSSQSTQPRLLRRQKHTEIM